MVETEIQDETTYGATMEALGRQDKPPAVLRFLMQLLESYRQNRRIGWSRPWNKYGITTFQSFKLRFPEDLWLAAAARSVLKVECPLMPDAARVFCDDLLIAGEPLMGFIFIQEYVDPHGNRSECATLSFGRVHGSRYRDRLDLILEAPLQGAEAGRFNKLRVYVDPYRGLVPPLWEAEVPEPLSIEARDLFDTLAATSWDWRADASRTWDHWTSAYIEYFGPRSGAFSRSHFHTARGPQARIPFGMLQPPSAEATETRNFQ